MLKWNISVGSLLLAGALCLCLACYDAADASPQALSTGFDSAEHAAATAGEAVAAPSLMPVRAVFSWNKEDVLAEQREQVMADLKNMRINTVFQWFSDSLDTAAISDFVAALSRNGIAVYALTGDAQWALETDAHSLLQAVKRCGEIDGLCGVVLDVEPQLTGEYAKDRAAVMEQYARNMIAAYDAAVLEGLSVIVCVPAHFDDEALQSVIRDGCDKVAVMAYYRGEELRYLEWEANLTRTYRKELICVSELQPAGSYGLTPRNTYHDAGLTALEEAWTELQNALPGQQLGFAFHSYEWLANMLRDAT